MSMNDNNKTPGRNVTSIPKVAFDMEYATQFKREMYFLREAGINPVFIKKVGEYNIPTYKYTKTPELFAELAKFYAGVAAERSYKQELAGVFEACAREVERLGTECVCGNEAE